MAENPRVWLPLKKTFKKGIKTTILIIPGASRMDKSELEEIIAWQTEKIEKETPKPKAVMPSQDVRNMLLEHLAFLRRKQRDPTKKYY